jgi:hypothetical protein
VGRRRDFLDCFPITPHLRHEQKIVALISISARQRRAGRPQVSYHSAVMTFANRTLMKETALQ